MKYTTLLFAIFLALSAAATEEGRLADCGSKGCTKNAGKREPFADISEFIAAVNANGGDKATPECTKGDCTGNAKKQLTNAEIASFFRSMGLNKITNEASEITRILSEMKVGVEVACSKFVKDNEFKKWGEVISSSFNRGQYKELYNGTPDLLRLCPNFPSMTDEQKDSVFILKSTLHAFFESSCDPNAKNPHAPNGIATGLFQLDKGREHRYSKGCSVDASKSAEGSIQCTLAMLNDTAKKGENIFSSNSHWAVSRPQNRERKAGFKKNAALTTMEAICKLSYCKSPPEECAAFINETQRLALQEENQQRRAGPGRRIAKR